MPKGGKQKNIIVAPEEREEDFELEPMDKKNPKPNKEEEAEAKKSKDDEEEVAILSPAAEAPPPQEEISKPKPATAPEQKNFWKKIGKAFSLISTVPTAEKVFFAENFRVMVKAGLSLSEALETLALQTKNKKFKSVLTEIKDGVMEGNTLASMLAKFPKIFPEYFINMIRVGEVSGNLEKNLEELSNQMKKDHELVSKIRGAMIYPAVIVVATVGIGILMFVYVIPSVLSVFDELKLKLPLATRILIFISKFINAHGILLAIIIVSAIIAFISFSRTKKGKNIFHFILLNLWIVGPIIKKVNLARFARTVSSLLKTDIPVIESFKITSTVLGNIHYRKACLDVAEKLGKGVPINSVLNDAPKLFPPLVTQMVSVGEKSGTLDVLLSELATFYEDEVSDITKNLSSIIEPILIVFLGGVVGLIAFAVISPIYTLSEGI